MKKFTKLSFLVLLTAFAMSGCSEKAGKTTIINNTTNPSTGNGGSGTNPIEGCDGVYRAGASLCYYDLPKITISGPGTYNVNLWSSANNLPDYFSPNAFRTDQNFTVRIKPVYSDAGAKSMQGRTCGGPTLSNFTKLKLSVMLRKEGQSIGQVKEITASVNSSAKAKFSFASSGTLSPFILEVIGAQTDHRCSGKYGSPLDGCSAGVLFDIPVSTGPYAECVSFYLEFSTDDTYEFPN